MTAGCIHVEQTYPQAAEIAHPRSNAPLHLYNFNLEVVPFFLSCPFGGSDLLSFLSATSSVATVNAPPQLVAMLR
jgi:hypothetical protein